MELREQLGIPVAAYEALLKAGLDHFSANRFGEAVTVLMGLSSLDKKDPRPLKLLATIMFLEDRGREALQFYEQARGLDPRDPYVLVAIAEIQLKAARFADATAALQELFALDDAGEHPATKRGHQLVQKYLAQLKQAK